MGAGALLRTGERGKPSLVARAALPVTVVTLLAVGFGSSASQAAPKSPLPVSPVSAGVLVAQAVHNGTLVPDIGIPYPGDPEIFPNVRASNNGNQPANENPVAANPLNDDQIASGANDYNCPSIQGFYASEDEGFSWPHQHCMSTLPGLSGFGDPVVAYDTSGNLYAFGIDATGSLTDGVIAMQKSSDNGATWSATTATVGATFANGLTDKEWIEADETLSSPFAGCLYMSITQFSSDFNTIQISVSHSCDGGVTWTTTFPGAAQNFPAVDQFSDLAVGRDGTVYVTWMHCVANGPAGDCGDTTATMMFSKSTNGGNTWSAPVPISTPRLAPDACFCAFYGSLPNTSERVSNIPVIDVDRSGGPHNGRLFITQYTWTGAYMKVQMVTSEDGGATWGAPKDVAPASNTHDQFFPWIASNPVNGMVAITWLDRRDDPANVKYAPWARFYKVPHAPFQKQFALSAVLSDPFKDGFGGSFMGDYNVSDWSSVALHLQYCSTLFNSTCQDTWTGVDFGD
jgi:hypothetical protein